VQRQAPGLPVILLTAHGSIPDAVSATRQGVFGFLTKPVDRDELFAAIDEALDQAPGATAEGDDAWRAAIITRSPEMDLAFALAQLVDVGTYALQARADTSTAHEVLVHLEAVLEEIILRGVPRLHDEDRDGRCVYDEAGWNTTDLVRLCVERIRGAASRDPEATRHLMHMLQGIRKVAEGCGASAVVSEVEHQVETVRALADATELQIRDRPGRAGVRDHLQR
jgi:DNA-binding response OmpR family regulator